MLRLVDYVRAKAKSRNSLFLVLPHVTTICRAIELCIAGELPDGKRNLVINLPPRFGKTDLLEAAVEWSIGHLPDSLYILSAYVKERAKESSDKIRNTMREEWYRSMFPAANLDRTRSDRMDEFHTTMRGGLRAAGVGGAITGFGAGQKRKGFAGFFGIDDPIKPGDSRSEIMRKKNIDWYTGTAQNRRNKTDTPYILIAQRTHPGDLSGWVLANEPELWYQVKIPGHDRVADVATWESTASLGYLKKLEQVDEFTYWSQYQQEPRHPTGSVIKEEWWQYYSDLEEVKKRCRLTFITADTSMKTKDANDPTVFQFWGAEDDKRLYLLDQVRGRWAFPDLVRHAKVFWDKHSDLVHGIAPVGMFIEDKVSGTSLIQVLEEYTEIKVIPWLPSDFELQGDDKVSRVKAASWSIYEGKVWLPGAETAPWVTGFVDECTGFQADMSHTHDDQVDTMTMAVLTWSIIK